MQLCKESPLGAALVNKFFRVVTKQDHLCFLPVYFSRLAYEIFRLAYIYIY